MHLGTWTLAGVSFSNVIGILRASRISFIIMGPIMFGPENFPFNLQNSSICIVNHDILKWCAQIIDYDSGNKSYTDSNAHTFLSGTNVPSYIL